MLNFPRSLLTASAGLLAMLPIAGQAQSNRLSAFEAPRESRAMVSLVVPFGQSRETSNTTPRLELQMVQIERDDAGFSILPDRNIVRKRTIGFTLDQHPQLAINGKAMAIGPAQNNLSTGEGIAIAGGLVAIAFLAAVLDFADAVDDISDPD